MDSRSSAADARGRGRSFRVKGALLRSLRCAQGWTQQEAADKAGFSDRLIRKAEAGEAIDLQSIALLAQLYSSLESRLTVKGLLDEPLDESARSSDPSQIEAVARRWYQEVWNNARLDTLDELLSPDCILHAKGTELRGQAAIRNHMQSIHAAFGDLALAIDHFAFEDQIAIARWHATAVHCGSWLGEPPSGRHAQIYGSSWITVRDRLIQEAWQVIDGPHFWPQAATNTES